MHKALVVVSLAATIFFGASAAHPGAYINPNLCPGGLFTHGVPLLGIQGCLSQTNCDNDLGKTTLGPGVGHSMGGVRFCSPGGVAHIVANADGEASLTIIDDGFQPVGASYCQDLDGDAVCGAKDPLAPAGHYKEPRVDFCASVTLDSPLRPGSKTLAQWQAGENWEPTRDVLIIPDGLGNGNAFRGTLPSSIDGGLGPTGNVCGTTYDGGTRGVVFHP